MNNRIRIALLGLLLAILTPATNTHAQIYTSLGVGVAQPIGDFDDVFDRGFTVRGQAGLSLLVAGAHVQGGWSNYAVDVDAGGSDSANIYHAGIGGRVGVGLFWVGANGAYFFGDGESGVGYFPEVGLGLMNLEAVADFRIDGSEKWIALRGAVKF